jgi:hypothetical protein
MVSSFPFIVSCSTINSNSLFQQFSTWGTHTFKGTQAVCKGYATFKIYSKISPLRYLSLQNGIPLWVWGYAKYYNIV